MWAAGLIQFGSSEGPYCNSTSARRPFRGPCHPRSTGWTKFQPQPAVGFVRAALIGFKYTTDYLDGGFVKVRWNRERTPRHSLASRAMTNGGYIRLPDDPISNSSAKATTFVCFCHFDTHLHAQCS
jgi:hypothetical protein